MYMMGKQWAMRLNFVQLNVEYPGRTRMHLQLKVINAASRPGKKVISIMKSYLLPFLSEKVILC